jgi:DNA-binding NtrC family response regulator
MLTMPVVMMSGHGTIDTAVEATRIGAFDFLEKPIALQKLLKTVTAALKHSEQLPKSDMSLLSLGKSAVINELRQRLEQVSMSKAPLLLIGEKGSGAELCAKFLHQTNTPWIELLESQRLADAPLDILEQLREGVLFIPEVSDLDKTQQKGLLVLLAKAEKYGTRVICGTSQPLPDLVAEGAFDNGLLQTLSVSTLRIPSLADHREDIPDLVRAMAFLLVETTASPYREFETAALNMLRNADWPGNLTQLDSVIRNLMQTSLGEKISLDDVNRVMEQFAPLQTAVVEKASSKESVMPLDLNKPLREVRDDFERLYFEHHIKKADKNMSRVAKAVELERTHLYRKLKQLGIKTK